MVRALSSATSGAARSTARAHRPVRAGAIPALLLAAALGACSPGARPADGPVGEEVQASLEGGSGAFDHSALTALYREGVVDGMVDYDVFERRRNELEAYLGDVADAQLEELAPGHLKALLLNAYNAYTILSILDHPGVGSIRDIDGVWTERTHAVGGHLLTLDNIEHNLLRPYFRDPRIHFAVNCASVSCAPLPSWAFDGDRVEEQLEEWTVRTLAQPKYLEVIDGRLHVTRLLDWYGGDFTAEGWSPRADTLAAFLAARAPDAVRSAVDAADGSPDIVFKDYDWGLNAVSSR